MEQSMYQEFLVSFPAYTLWIPERPSPFLLGDGQFFAYPIFTDLDSVQTFRSRQEMEGVSILEFPDPFHLKNYLETPPNPAKKMKKFIP